MKLFKTTLIFFFLYSTLSVAQAPARKSEPEAIQEALRLETHYFYQRDTAKWAGQWSHKPFVMKCYVRNGGYEEQLGWPLIKQSAMEYMKAYPTPETPPQNKPSYTITVFENSAFVTYAAKDEKGNQKREIRLMVKEDGTWKIGYMSTNYILEQGKSRVD